MTNGRTPQDTWGAILDLDDTLYPRSAYVESALVAVVGFLQRTHVRPEFDARRPLTELA